MSRGIVSTLKKEKVLNLIAVDTGLEDEDDDDEEIDEDIDKLTTFMIKNLDQTVVFVYFP